MRIPDTEVLSPFETQAGWLVCPIHYSHDPEKGEKWKEEQRAAYDRQEDWDREMEIDFSAQLGAAAYPAFNDKVHLRDDLIYHKTRPIWLCCDFNVDPCVFVIAQLVNGNVHVIDEICLAPASVPDMVTEFRNRYPDHPAEIHIYGDSNGMTRVSQTAKSDYELMLTHFAGYPCSVKLKVSRAHPRSRDRINSLNHKLKGREGEPGIFIHRTACPELVSDFREVVLRPDGKDVLKVYREGDPYRARTHASDALGYCIHREFPVIKDLAQVRSKAKKRMPLKYENLLGSI